METGKSAAQWRDPNRHAPVAPAPLGANSNLAQRIGESAGTAVLRYEPIWRPDESVMCGYLATRPAGPDRARTENLSWEDLILLGAATRSLRDMMESGRRAVLLLPLSANTLLLPQFSELYSACFRSLPAQLRRYVVIELGNLPAHDLPPEVEERIRDIAVHCRSMVVNTASPLRKYEPVQFAKIQAYGFNLTSALSAMGEGSDPAQLCRRFRSLYHGSSRLYITGVDSARALQAAKENGYYYISGSAIAKSQDEMKPSFVLPQDGLRTHSMQMELA
jgi:hypothetical protein